MKLEDIYKEWSVDNLIDKSTLDQASIDIPKLHHKYMQFLSKERMVFRVLQENKKKLVQQLEDYYTGKIDGKDIGKEPWQLTETKSSSEKRVETDPSLIEMNLKIFVQEEKVLALKEIISNINQRNFQIKNAIDFLRWSQGSV